MRVLRSARFVLLFLAAFEDLSPLGWEHINLTGDY
jgi:hypothetical protein